MLGASSKARMSTFSTPFQPIALPSERREGTMRGGTEEGDREADCPMTRESARDVKRRG